MSAFIVQNKTINNIVSELYCGNEQTWEKRIIKDATGYDINTEEGLKGLALELHKLNIAGVSARYRGNVGDFEPFVFKLEIHTKPMQALKSLKCLLYQCAEGGIPEQSTLYKLLERIDKSWCDKVISNLPEYEQAKWDDI